MAEIKLVNVSKTFDTEEGPVHALSDVNLSIHKGDIYGIIGMSGAGKSTLVRCLNFLEKPTSGDVIIQGVSLKSLNEKELREERKKISMIFQNFNLLMQKTVIDNVCFPMYLAHTPKAEARKKAMEYLRIVGLEDKANTYPSKLSGGQQQRVAIARALASKPEILLCDEATSALDPATTKQILALLKKINNELGITIVIITHAMDVVEDVCSHVAIMENGQVQESGEVETIFANPQSAVGKRLVLKDVRSEALAELKTDKTFRIVFDKQSAFEPVIANAILTFQTPINILGATTKNVHNQAKGEMIVGIPSGHEDEFVAYFKERGLNVEEVDING